MRASGTPSYPASSLRGVSGRIEPRRIRAALGLLLLPIVACLCLTAADKAGAAELPELTMDPTTPIGITDAEIHATIKPNGSEIFWNFQYVSDAEYQEDLAKGGDGFTNSHGSGGGIVTPNQTEATAATMLGGLTAGTEYHARLLTQASGHGYFASPETTFTTLGAVPPTVSVSPTPVSVSYVTATIDGEIDPEGGNIDPISGPLPINWQLQVSTDPVVGAWSPAASGEISPFEPEGGGPIPALSTEPIPIEAHLESLGANTTYTYRLVAFYGGAKEAISATEGTFTTKEVALATVVAETLGDVTDNSAKATGTISVSNTDPAFDAACTVDYVTDQQFQVDGYASASSAACEPATVTGTSSTPVEVTLTDLEPDTTYHARLRGHNAGGDATDEYPTFHTDAVAPLAVTGFAARTSGASVLLGGEVNPHNSPVVYQFQWGATTSYGNSVPAAPTSVLPADNTRHIITVPLSGLQPGVSYHFRISATNTETDTTTVGADHTFEIGASAQPQSCPNEQLRAETNSTRAPDCRAYELVTPAVKDFPFGQVNVEFARVSKSGDKVGYFSFGPLPGAKAGTFENDNVARRTATGWVNTPTSPPQRILPGTGKSWPLLKGYTEDLSHWLFLGEEPYLTEDAPRDVPSMYVGDLETGSYKNLGADAVGAEATAVWMSEDGEQVLYSGERYPGGGTGSWEYDHGQTRKVGIFPDGTEAPGAQLGQSSQQGGRDSHVVSTDGSRVIWSTGNKNGLYENVDGGIEGGGSVIHISESQRTVPAGSDGAIYWDASVNGHRVLFTSEVALTDSATEGPGEDLYGYDTDTGVLTDLTTATENPGEKAGVIGVLGCSDDGQVVYFVAEGLLDRGGKKGSPNLYVADHGNVSYLGTLVPQDNFLWGQIVPQGPNQGLSFRVSAKGDLAFKSSARLTAYDNVEPGSGKETEQVYFFQPAVQRMTCLSCRPDGAPPHGSGDIRPPINMIGLSRNITSDEETVFFDSSDALVAGDENGTWDAYEWTDGDVQLISSGTDPDGAHFQDATPDGSTVMFSSVSKLVAQDVDGHRNLFAARVDGGFPRPPVPPAPCEGEGCRGAGSIAPSPESAGTSAFNGPGNPKPKTATTIKKQRAKALKACRKKSNKAKRKRCEAHVKKKFAHKRNQQEAK